MGRTLLKPHAYFNYFTLLAPFTPVGLLTGSRSGGASAGGVATAAALEHASAAEAWSSSSLLLEATTVATAFTTLTRGAILARAAIEAAGATGRTVLAGERAGSGARLLGSNVGLGNNVLAKNTVDGGEVLLEVSDTLVGEGVVTPAPVELLLDELARQQRLDKPQHVKVGHVGQGAVSRTVDVVLNSNDTLCKERK